MNNEFYLYCAKSKGLSDKATDWFIKSFKFKYGSLEWKICRLKHEIYARDALVQLKEAVKLCQVEKN